MSDSDIVQDFLGVSYENLDRLDRELVGLEKNPHDRDALGTVFRTIHTIKSTCGFLGFNKLEKVAHFGKNLLTRLRDGQLTLCTRPNLPRWDSPICETGQTLAEKWKLADDVIEVIAHHKPLPSPTKTDA
jgi:chemotaxis protein histidine kinase CheA